MKEKEEIIGVIYIYTSFNNTIINLTDLTGKTIARISGGQVTKQDRLKANPTIAMFVAKRIAEIAKDLGINSLFIKIKAQTGMTSPGPGAYSAVKTFGKEGFKILNVIDITKVPRGGPKKKGGRRGRRV